VSEAGAVGAAILAGVGSATMPSLPDAVRHLVKFDRTFEPNTANRGYCDDKFGKYRELYAALGAFNASYATP
jgi:xylulokinase